MFICSGVDRVGYSVGVEGTSIEVASGSEVVSGTVVVFGTEVVSRLGVVHQVSASWYHLAI